MVTDLAKKDIKRAVAVLLRLPPVSLDILKLRKVKNSVKNQRFLRKFLLFLLCVIFLLPLMACKQEALPSDAEDPSDALAQYVRDFWESDIYDDAIFEAFWDTPTASEDLKNFNRYNALNAKLKIRTMSNFSTKTMEVKGTKATVRLYVHGMNFGEYAETYLEEFDKLQGSVIFVDGEMMGLTNEELTFALRLLPIGAADNENVSYRDFEQDFKLRYKNGKWVITSPAYKGGKVFLELFAQHINKVLTRRYKFRPGLKELTAVAKRNENRNIKKILKEQFWGVLSLTAGILMILYSLCQFVIYFFKKRKKEADKRYDKKYERLLQSLTDDSRRVDVKGIVVEIRDCADRGKGKPDPRTSASANLSKEDFKKKRKTIDKNLRKNKGRLLKAQNASNDLILEDFREHYGWKSEDKAGEIEREKIEFEGNSGNVVLWKYGITSRKAKPCIIFFHGGGFVSGNALTLENHCKLLAKLLGGYVFSVEYPLAPEHKFSKGFDCCYESIEWIYDNAAKLGVDPKRIGIAGDGAGGNLALACAVRAGKEKKEFIRYMGLIYPIVSFANKDIGKFYYFEQEAYENDDNDPYIAEQIKSQGEIKDKFKEWYLEKDTDPMQPHVSPITASLRGLPVTLVMTAEYDFLRLECEELSRRLKSAEVKHRHIRYGGVVHGTFERLGYMPQAEDMLQEMAKDLRQLR